MNIFRSRSLPWVLAGGATLALVGAVVLPQFFESNDSAGDDTVTTIVTPASDGGTDTIRTLEQSIKDNPQDFGAHLNLAYAYLQRVRETGDPSLYSTTENVLDKAEDLSPNDSELFAARSVLALARHDFAGALEQADKAQAADPELARYYGLRADALIELGRYPEAIDALQAMADRRPDFSLFTRMAHARELYGDPEGAIEALESAVEAGSSVPENMAWAYAQLGDRSFELGDFNTAAQQYARSLSRMEDFPGALAGQAKLAGNAGDVEAAAALYQRAFAKAPLAEYAIALGDLYATNGRQADADKQYALVNALDKLQRENGVNTDVELAIFRADHGVDLDETVDRARKAYEVRPSVYAADALAWALYKDGNLDEARKYSLEAIKLGTRNPVLLYHASVIAQEVGENAEAREMLSIALRGGPSFSILHGEDAERRLAELQSAALQP